MARLQAYAQLHVLRRLSAPAWPSGWRTCARCRRSAFGALRAGDQFRAIEGVIIFFQRKGLGAPGSWVSMVDAAIVEAVQRGGAIALGVAPATATGGNPGTALWVAFLRTRKAGGFPNRDVRSFQ
jgi:hypothetical protein